MCVSVLEFGWERAFVRVEVEEEESCCWCCCCPPSICVCVCVPAPAAAADVVEPCVCVGGLYVDVVVAVPFTLTRRIGPAAPPAAEGPLPPCMMVVCVCVFVDGGTPPPAAPAPPRPLGLLMTRLCACSQGLRGEARVCGCVCGLVLEGCAVEGAAEEGGWRLEGKGAMNGLGCVCACVCLLVGCLYCVCLYVGGCVFECLFVCVCV